MTNPMAVSWKVTQKCHSTNPVVMAWKKAGIISDGLDSTISGQNDGSSQLSNSQMRQIPITTDPVRSIWDPILRRRESEPEPGSGSTPRVSAPDMSVSNRELLSF